MLSIELTMAGIVLVAASGLFALLPFRGEGGTRTAAAVLVAGSGLGLAGAISAFFVPAPPALDYYWFLPWGSFSVSIDPLSAFFLCPVFIVPALGSIYGLGYFTRREEGPKAGKLAVFYGLLAAAMGLVVIARDAVLFLVAWEVMALAAWFAASIDDDRPEVRKSGWIYLIATHVGTLCLFAMFALWRAATGSFALSPLAAGSGAATALFLLALVGFGFKAGFMPLHVWLPGAHANAPSHVSAVMSGVMLKMGIYGIVRMTGLLAAIEPWMGSTLLVVGLVSGIAGIAFATGQKDLKRVLAYSSIENVGIIGMGLGLALLGRATGRPVWVVLGFGGALLHVWNHGLFKSLLFLDAGSIMHATGTRDIEALGGLGKKMPFTAAAFVLGAVAISGLPPLNGFAGEWLLYLGFFDTLVPGGPRGIEAAAAAAGGLAMIGAIAVACFVRLLGAVFQGEPRKVERVAKAHDPGLAMKLPMVLLAAACLAIGFFPGLAAPALEAATAAWLPAGATVPHIADLAPQAWIGWLGLALAAAVALLALAMRLHPRAARPPRQGTWDCGYAAPTSRMEYTATSFGQSVVRLFSFVLWPSRREPRVEGPFPAGSRFSARVPDPVLDRALRPLFKSSRRWSSMVRFMQQGQTQLYILYILIIAIVLLAVGGTGVPR